MDIPEGQPAWSASCGASPRTREQRSSPFVVIIVIAAVIWLGRNKASTSLNEATTGTTPRTSPPWRPYSPVSHTVAAPSGSARPSRSGCARLVKSGNETAVKIRCAECGCVVDRGVRVTPCGDPECCCKELPVRGSGKDQTRETGGLSRRRSGEPAPGPTYLARQTRVQGETLLPLKGLCRELVTNSPRAGGILKRVHDSVLPSQGNWGRAPILIGCSCRRLEQRGGHTVHGPPGLFALARPDGSTGSVLTPSPTISSSLRRSANRTFAPP